MNKPDHVIYAHESLLARPQGFLRLTILFAVLGVTVIALADFGSVWLLLHQHLIDDMGNSTASGFMISTAAVMSLALYWLAGSEWHNGRRRRGNGFYAVALILLLWAVWDWARPWNTSLWFDFSPDTGLLSGNAGRTAPGWFQLLIDVPLAIAFSACGLLFIRSKRHLGEVLEQWRNQQTALAKIAQERQATASENSVARRAAELAHLEQHRESIAAYLVRRAHDGDAAGTEARRNALLTAAQDIRIPQFRSHELIAEADKLSARLSGKGQLNSENPDLPPTGKPAPSVGKPKTNGAGKTTAALLGLVVLLHLSSPHPALAQSAGDQCAAAPVLQLLLDVSGSSPLADRQYLAAVIPVVEDRIRGLPMCSEVLIVTVGDARTVPSMPHLKVLARTVPGKGATRDEIAREVRQLLLAMPERIDKSPQERSELIAAFADAARNTNPQTKEPNQIVMLSDGVESSNLADCGKTARCRFPAPSFSLAGTSVAIYGVGLGLPGERAMALTNNWKRFFAKAGVKADLRRTF